MTIQLAPRTAQLYGKSKRALQDALNSGNSAVAFDDPSMFSPAHGGSFMGVTMAPGESFPVVMDPQTRMRFASVTRKADGTFRVT